MKHDIKDKNNVRSRKQNKNEKIVNQKKKDNTDEKPIEPKYGPLPAIKNHRLWARGVLILGTLIVVYFTSKSEKEIILAKQKELIQGRGQSIQCSEDYKNEVNTFPGCVPEKCGRAVSDRLVTELEAETLLDIGKRGLSLGGSDGGASILDLHSGALSKGRHFVNIYKLKEADNLFNIRDFAVYRVVRTKIQQAVAHNFGISAESLYLTHPTFFSKLSSEDPATPHDEYWHPHTDKETYDSFHYTSLLYLTDYGIDFQGGRFIFVEKDNSTVVVEPRKGRVSMFTSGSENIHFVERVKSGVRYALTVSFTCDKKYAIKDPTIAS